MAKLYFSSDRCGEGEGKGKEGEKQNDSYKVIGKEKRKGERIWG